jgi:L-threonylcarbamoyladenylate synthase
VLTDADARTFERCMSVGGIAVFPADTVYGLAVDPDDKEAVERLYLLKRRPPAKRAAVLFFDRDLALAALPELGPRTRAAVEALTPGGVTLLVPNPAGRFPLAAGETLGLRVPALGEAAAALRAVRWPVLQSSANLSGGADPRRLDEVDERLRDAADLVLDAGELPGTPSTVIDLTAYERDGSWSIVREGALRRDEVERALQA